MWRAILTIYKLNSLSDINNWYIDFLFWTYSIKKQYITNISNRNILFSMNDLNVESSHTDKGAEVYGSRAVGKAGGLLL